MGLFFVCFLPLCWESGCCWWLKAGHPEVSVFSLLCFLNSPGTFSDTSAKSKTRLYREAMNEAHQQSILMTEVERGRNTAWIDTLTSFQCGLTTAATTTASVIWLLLSQSEHRRGPLQEQEVRLNLMLLNHLFYWHTKTQHIVHWLYIVSSIAEEEGISLAPVHLEQPHWCW